MSGENESYLKPRRSDLEFRLPAVFEPGRHELRILSTSIKLAVSEQSVMNLFHGTASHQEVKPGAKLENLNHVTASCTLFECSRSRDFFACV